MPTDCAFYTEFTLPLNVTLKAAAGRVDVDFETILHIDMHRSVYLSADVPDEPSSDAPNDEALSLSGRYSPAWAIYSTVPVVLSGTWSFSASTAAKSSVAGGSAFAGVSVVWIEDFDARREGFTQR